MTLPALAAPSHGWHIDWLTMQQDHGWRADLPVLDVELDRSADGIAERSSFELPAIRRHDYQRTDTQTGEHSRWQSPLDIGGSYRTSLRVSCDGRLVRVSGNPSKFCRLDNLFGYQRLDDAVAVFNCLLAHFGLPPFTKATFCHQRQLLSESQRNMTVTDGARVSMVHLTRNWCLGDAQSVLPFIRGMSGYSMAAPGAQRCNGRNLGFLYPNGRTATWMGGSRRLFVKLYDKAFEMQEHWPSFELTAEEEGYLRQLQQFLHDLGCVREEYEFFQMTLRDNGCDVYGLFDDADLNELFLAKSLMMNRTEVSTMNWEDVSDKLIELGYPVRTARRLQMIANNYYHGVDMASLFNSKSARNKAAAILAEIGIDIKTPCDVTRLMPRVQVINVQPLAIPDWYRMPSLNDVRSHLSSIRRAA